MLLFEKRVQLLFTFNIPELQQFIINV